MYDFLHNSKNLMIALPKHVPSCKSAQSIQFVFIICYFKASGMGRLLLFLQVIYIYFRHFNDFIFNLDNKGSQYFPKFGNKTWTILINLIECSEIVPNRFQLWYS